MNRKTHILALLLASASLTACGMEPQERYERAQLSFEQSNFESARLDLISALKDDPANTDMLVLLARTQLAMADGDGAIATLDKLATPGATPADYVSMRGEALVHKQQYDDALQMVEGEDSAYAHRVRGLAHIGLKDREAAKTAFGTGISAYPKDAPLFASYARFLLATGDRAGAIAQAEKALAIDDDHYEAMLVKAQAQALGNRMPEALASFDKALAEHPDNLALVIGKIGVLGDMGRLEDTGELLDAALERSPDEKRLVFLKARLAAEREEWAEVRSILQPREAILRDDPNLGLLYGEAMFKLDQVEQARSWLTPLVRNYPNARKARKLLGEAQLASGDAAGALKTLSRLDERPDVSPEELALLAKAATAVGSPKAKDYDRRSKLPAPEWIGAELAKADSAMRNQNWKQAVENYRRIAERSSKPNAMVLNNLAYSLGQTGEKSEAIELALRAVQIEPENASILDTAGWLLVESGTDPDRGRALLAKAIRLDPDNAVIASHVKQAAS